MKPFGHWLLCVAFFCMVAVYCLTERREKTPD